MKVGSIFFFIVYFSYKPHFPSFGWLVGWLGDQLVGRSVCYNFFKRKGSDTSMHFLEWFIIYLLAPTETISHCTTHNCNKYTVLLGGYSNILRWNSSLISIHQDFSLSNSSVKAWGISTGKIPGNQLDAWIPPIYSTMNSTIPIDKPYKFNLVINYQ